MSTPAVRSIRSVAGSILCGWDTANGCYVHAMPRPMKPRKRPSKKKLPEQVQALQQAHPESDVQLWATDQHRIGLKPILRRIWVRRGSRPRVAVQHRFQWLYLYSFVQPATGQTEWLL